MTVPQPGQRIELVSTDDQYTRLRSGDRGTVTRVKEVTGMGTPFTQISVKWDDGSTLMLIPESGDDFRLVGTAS